MSDSKEAPEGDDDDLKREEDEEPQQGFDGSKVEEASLDEKPQETAEAEEASSTSQKADDSHCYSLDDTSTASDEAEEREAASISPPTDSDVPKEVSQGQEVGEDREGSSDDDSERRQAARKGVKLNRLISSKVIDGELQRECYLHLVDISEGGMRINSDDPFPSDHPFNLEIGLAAFGTELATRKPRIDLPVRLVWSKSLVGGMVVSGLAFHEITQEQSQIVHTIMLGATPHGRRQHFRLNRVLGVEIGPDSESSKWMYPLTLDLSIEGMRICQSEALNIGEHFPIKIFLEFGLPTIETKAEVMWQEVMPSGRVQIGLRFDDISDHHAMAIKTYIDQCMGQDQPYRNQQ